MKRTLTKKDVHCCDTTMSINEDAEKSRSPAGMQAEAGATGDRVAADGDGKDGTEVERRGPTDLRRIKES